MSDNILKQRKCWECKQSLDFKDFCTENSYLSEKYLKTYWQHPNLEFFCCFCYPSRKNRELRREGKKVVFAGMDNSGKTATLNLLHTHAIKENLCPTKGIHRHVLQLDDELYCIWDLGGANRYRGGYLKRNRAFIEAKEILFFIDVQDFDYYQKSLNYLSLIMELLREQHTTNVTLFIFLHKSDPDLIHAPNHLKNLGYLEESIKNLNITVPYRTCETSIYNFEDNLRPPYNTENLGSFIMDILKSNVP